MQSILLITLLVSLGGFWFLNKKLLQKTRNKIKASEFPLEWLAILQENVPLYSLLPDALKKQLHEHVKVFIAEKRFEGCAGLEITDEIKVTIAGQACILLLNRNDNYYPNLISILVYPSSYFAEHRQVVGGAVMSNTQHRSGESWDKGLLVLSWDDVLRGAFDIHDGHNVVLHEFAHQLDQDFGSADGLPRLENKKQYSAWAKVLANDYEHLLSDIQSGHKTVIDAYGATNPAEFFAVITETFFEKPQALSKKHPELFQLLLEFYKLNPLEWYENEA